MRPLDILIISSRPKEHSANLGKDFMDALIFSGHRVQYNYLGMEDDIQLARSSVTRLPLWRKLLTNLRVFSLFHKFGFFFPFERRMPFYRNGWIMVNGIEQAPILDPQLVVSRLGNRYDLIISLFWENVISSCTLRVLAEKFKCPVFIFSVDMAPMTGGCYYFGNCRNLFSDCKNCPAVGGLLGNFAKVNFNNKRKNYNAIRTVCLCNTYMREFAERTGLFRKIVTMSALINSETFHELDRAECLKDLKIDFRKDFIILMRYAEDPKKGSSYAIEAFRSFSKKLSTSERDRVLILMIGKDRVMEKDFGGLSCSHLGFINTEQLVKAYSVSNIFLSASIDEAGPTMVNQAMMCGTPVVSFECGTALDVIENGKNGFRVPLKNSEEMGQRIYDIFSMEDENYRKLRKGAFKVAKEWNERDVFVKTIEDAYSEMITWPFDPESHDRHG